MKKLLLSISLRVWFVKAAYRFWLYGPYGVCNVVKSAPVPFIQPLLTKYGASIGKNCMINTGVIIEHDCKIGDYCHIAPGVHISGTVSIGELSFIGIGATIIQGIKIGKNVTIGAGSVVIKDIPDNVIALGNPAKIVKSKK